jgi:hypothetical protein
MSRNVSAGLALRMAASGPSSPRRGADSAPIAGPEARVWGEPRVTIPVGFAPAPLLEHLVTGGYLGRRTGPDFREYS